MIQVKKPLIDDESWKKLITEAALQEEWVDVVKRSGDGRSDLIDKFDKDEELQINAALYKRYMDFLIRLFNGKCAYCEAKITLSQPGDVEHFRPKGRVVDDNFKPIRIRHPVKGDMDHPGYYWLAYEWRNLLPSCIDCNRYRRHGEQDAPLVNKADAGAGKADRFPVRDEAKRAVVPDSELDEWAMLINPSERDPSEHLEFVSNGTIKPKTPEGEATLKVFGLNIREDLQEARAYAFDDAEANFERYMDAIKAKSVERRQRSAKRINRMMAGKDAYSAMHRLAILTAVEYWRQQGIPIELPLREQ